TAGRRTRGCGCASPRWRASARCTASGWPPAADPTRWHEALSIRSSTWRHQVTAAARSTPCCPCSASAPWALGQIGRTPDLPTSILGRPPVTPSARQTQHSCFAMAQKPQEGVREVTFASLPARNLDQRELAELVGKLADSPELWADQVGHSTAERR